MGIEDERVRRLDPAPEAAALGQDHRRAGHRGVDVEPEARARGRPRAIAATGSMAVVAVVPVVATRRKAAARRRSRRIACVEGAGSHRDTSPSTGIARTFSRPKPASSAAFSTELWPGRGVDDQRPRLGLQAAAGEAVAGDRSRAQISATSVLVEAVSWMHAAPAVGETDHLRASSRRRPPRAR